VAGEIILIVDDHPLNLKLARVTLAAAGYAVRTAVDAETALASLREVRPDLVLMDLHLPGVDGFELTRRIKADPAMAGVPVVALTALAMRKDEQRAREAGVDGYLTKPVDTARLPAQVAGYLAAAGRAEP
jgi:CheY-like chemotaxis protein